MTKNIHEELRDSLAEKIDNLYQEEAKEEVPEEQEEPEVVEEKEINENNEENVDDEQETDGEEVEVQELERKLSGQPKEFKDLVKSVNDPELRAKILEAGRIARAREDRKSLELGNLKKDYNNATEILKRLETNPAETLKNLAKATKIDLKSLIDPVQEDDYEDYRTPEERKRDKEVQDLKDRLDRKEREEIQRYNQEVADVINNFKNSTDSEGNLNHPHFERVRLNMSILMKAHTDLSIEKAYAKAVLLDDELREESEKKILRKASELRKKEVEDAKKDKRLSSRSSNIKTAPASAKEGMRDIAERFMNGTL